MKGNEDLYLRMELDIYLAVRSSSAGLGLAFKGFSFVSLNIMPCFMDLRILTD